MMKIVVSGNGHLATVTTVCLAHVGHSVNGPSLPSIMKSEPGLSELSRPRPIFQGIADVVILAYDTPVDDFDEADHSYVFSAAYDLLKYIEKTTLVVVSSQLPVGSIAKLEHIHPDVKFACCPENLTRGNAVERFLHPDRIVCGVRRESDKAILINLWEPFGPIEWMSIESAEMSKHAINAFLATSICFANEIAEVARRHGADPREVERALKSDSRIGQRAYLRPGEPYTGGTLGRDVRYLEHMSNAASSPLLHSIRQSNEARKILDVMEAEQVAQ